MTISSCFSQFPYHLGGGFEYFLNVHPNPWGFMIQFDGYMFQMGWFNHKLVLDEGKYILPKN